MQKPCSAARRTTATRQLRVSRRILCIPVMSEVERTEILGRQQQRQAAEESHCVVEPSATEGGTVDGFVQRGEEENEDGAMQRHRRHQEETALCQHHQRAASRQRPDMAEETEEARAVGALAQRRERAAIEILGNEISVHVATFRSGLSIRQRPTSH